VTRWFALWLCLGCSPAASKAPASSRDLGRFGVVRAPAQSPLFGASGQGTTVLAVQAGVAGDRVSSLLEVPDDSCAVVIARGSATIDDLDLAAYAEDGTAIGTDEGPDKDPALVICPPHPRRIWLSARIAAGTGLVALGAGRVRPADAERARIAYGVKPGPGTQLGPLPALEEKLASHRADIGGSWQDLRRVPVPLDPQLPTRISTPIEAGRCVDALVVPGNDVGHVELLAFDAAGVIVGRGQSAGRDRFAVVCATAETPLVLEIRPHSGRGTGVLLLSRTRAGSERDVIDPVRLEAFPANEIGAALARAKESLGQAGYPAGRTLLTGSLEVGRRSTYPLSLPAGCTRLEFVGGAPLRGIRAWIWSPEDELIAALESGGQGVLFVCGRGGPLRLDAEASLRPGPFALLLHGEPGASVELGKAPLAAGRLLSQVIERGVLRRGSEIGLVRRFELSEASIDAFELTVPFGRCIDVALGLDKGAVGAEIRLVSAASGKEIALGRGPYATSARVCALDAGSVRENLKTRAELRVASGHAAGLVATRMSSPTR
jgi:hypothetical protein